MLRKVTVQRQFYSSRFRFKCAPPPPPKEKDSNLTHELFLPSGGVDPAISGSFSNSSALCLLMCPVHRTDNCRVGLKRNGCVCLRTVSDPSGVQAQGWSVTGNRSSDARRVRGVQTSGPPVRGATWMWANQLLLSSSRSRERFCHAQFASSRNLSHTCEILFLWMFL